MIIKKNKIVKSKRNFLVDFFASKKNAPLVIFSHGFKGFKDWGLFNQIAEYFCYNGFSFAKHNFSFNGTTINNPIDFEDLDAFGNNNYSKELDDLTDLINYLINHKNFQYYINSDQIYLMGHSRGGSISLLKSAEDKRIKKLITWSSPADFSNRFTSQIERWKKENVIFAFNGRTKQKMPLYYQFYKDFLENRIRLDISSASKSILIPYLIVHGLNDEAVSIKNAHKLNRWCKQSVLLEIKNASHTFNVSHPPKNNNFTPQLLKVLEESIRFLKI